MKKRILANLTLLLTAMIWGFAFVAQKSASSYIGPFTFNGTRFLLGSITLIPVIFIFERKDFKDKKRLKDTVKYGIITGFILFVASTLQQFGVSMMTQASKVSFITGLYTVFVPVAGIFFGKKVRINVWVGAFLAVVGLYLISVVGTNKIETGDLVTFIGAFFWTAHILVIDRFIDRVSPIKYSCVQFFSCALFNLILVPFFEFDTFSVSNIMSAGISILYAGVMSSGVAYTLQVIGQKNSEPTEASIILSTESVFGGLGCMLILHEFMSVSAYIGCLLIFAGILISQIRLKRE